MTPFALLIDLAHCVEHVDGLNVITYPRPIDSNFVVSRGGQMFLITIAELYPTPEVAA